MDRKSAAPAVSSRAPQPQSQLYRDEADAVSMRTTRSDYDYDDVPQLPSYSDSVAGDGAIEPTRSDLPPADEYRVITPPKSAADGWRNRKGGNTSCSQVVSLGSETTVRMDERLSDPTRLYDYIHDYLRVVQPRPAVRIQGWHWETRKKNNKNEQERVFDFDIVLSLQHFLSSADEWWEPSTPENGDKVYRGSWRKTRAKGFTQDIEVGADRKPELLDWCEDYCTNKSALKIFRVARKVTGLDTNAMKDRVESMVRGTHYRGHIDVTFPIAEKNVDIYTPHWVNQARIGWVRWIFYLTFLWIFMWPVLLFLTKRWTVYQVEWRCSRTVQNREGGQSHLYTDTVGAWAQRHTNLIKSLVLDKFHGDASSYPLDVDSQRQRRSGSLSQTGNANVDTAVSILQGGVSVWNTLNGRGGDNQGWGADS